MSSGTSCPGIGRLSELIGAEGDWTITGISDNKKGYRSLRAPRTSAESRPSGPISLFFCSMTVDQIFCQDDERRARADQDLALHTVYSFIAAAQGKVIPDCGIFYVVLHAADRYVPQLCVEGKERHGSLKGFRDHKPAFANDGHRRLPVQEPALSALSKNPHKCLYVGQGMIQPRAEPAVDQELSIAPLDSQPCRCHRIGVILDDRQL